MITTCTFELTPEDRRAYSQDMVTKVADLLTVAWLNWA